MNANVPELSVLDGPIKCLYLICDIRMIYAVYVCMYVCCLLAHPGIINILFVDLVINNSIHASVRGEGISFSLPTSSV